MNFFRNLGIKLGFIHEIPNKKNDLDQETERFLNNLNIPKSEPIKTFQTKEYKLAGVTYKNEDGKDIQKEIKKILREYVSDEIITKDEMYGGYSNSEIKDMDISVSQYEDISFDAKLKEDIFEDSPCVKVYIKRSDYTTFTHIGYIPKKYKQIQEVLDIIHNYENIKLTLYVVGGKIKESKVETDDEYKERFYVDTIELDYGFRLYIEYK